MFFQDCERITVQKYIEVATSVTVSVWALCHHACLSPRGDAQNCSEHTVVSGSDSWKALIKRNYDNLVLSNKCMDKGISVLKRYKCPYFGYVV